MLRDYQIEPVRQAYEILKNNGIVYLNAEMRTGKTTMALTLANMINPLATTKRVLFVTVKKLVVNGDVVKDYEREALHYHLDVINYEQLAKVTGKYDVVIADEAHKFGCLRKPNIRTNAMRKICCNSYLILMSGTPYPESMSQLYHQFWLSNGSPFKHPNFYKWAAEFVNVKEKILRGIRIRDYSDANRDKIMSVVGKYFVKITQQEAGFKIHEITESIIELPVDPKIHQLVNLLVKNRVYQFRDGDTVVCDTPASLQCKIHQLFSGTIKTDNGTKVLDTTKAKFIREKYQGDKIIIFYKYIAEGEALKEEFQNEWTDSPSAFLTNDKRIFISQINSGSTGVNLSSADTIIFYNIDFSYVQYAQATARTKALERVKEAKVHWLFAQGGIERKIFDVVQKKKDYSSYYFRRDFREN